MAQKERDILDDVLNIVRTARTKDVVQISKLAGRCGQERGWEAACKMIEEGVRALIKTE
jgi:hypothetical protein